MKQYSATWFAALALLAPAWNSPAQDADQPQPPARPRLAQREDRRDQADESAPEAPRPRLRRDGGPGPGLPEEARPGRDRIRAERRQLPPLPPPLFAALDVNHDGVIDAKEIKHASEALKKLDHNGDGKLTRDELMPRPPLPPEGGRDRMGDRMGERGGDRRMAPQARAPRFQDDGDRPDRRLSGDDQPRPRRAPQPPPGEE